MQDKPNDPVEPIKDAARDAVSEYVVRTYAFRCPYCGMFDTEEAERRDMAAEWAADHFRECENSPYQEQSDVD